MSSPLARLAEAVRLTPPGSDGWPDAVVGLYSAALLLIWLASLAAPVLLYSHGRRQAAPLRRLFTLLGVFVGCGGLAAALIAVAPAAGPWAGGAAMLAAAAVAWGATLALLRLLPRALGDVEREARADDLERLRLLEAAVAASGDGVLIAAPAGPDCPGTRIVYANPAFERLTGYAADEAVGKSPSILPDADTLAPVRAALRGAEPVRLEVAGRQKDGSRVWAEWHVVPVSGGSGRAGYWVAVLRDTTGQRRGRDEVRRARDFLTSVLENVPVPVVVADADDRYQLVNPAWERAFGVAGKDALGRTPDDVLPAAEAAASRRQLAAARAGGGPVREERAAELPGGRRVFLAVAFPLPGPDGSAGLVGMVRVDVTDQKRAEESVRALNGELRRRVEEVEALIDLSPVAIAVAEDPAGRVVHVNRVLRELLGLPAEPDPGLTPAPVRLQYRFRRDGSEVKPDDLPMQQALARGVGIDGVELQVVRPDGTTRVVVNSARPLFDDAHRVRGCVSVYTDITDRVAAERALRDSERRYRGLVENAADAILVLGPDGRILDANPAACEGLGYARDELLALGVGDIDPCARRVTIAPGETATVAARHRRKDGTTVPVEVRLAVLDPAAGTKLAVARDVTDRERAAAALREGEERFRRVFEDAPIGIYRAAPDGRILMANPAAARMIGPAAAAPVGAAGGWDAPDCPGERAAEVRGQEFAWQQPDGSVVYVRENARAVRGPGGAILYYEGTLEDITDRRRAEEALREREEFLRALVAHIPCGVFWKDRESRFLGCNDQFARDHGFDSPDRVVGRTDREMPFSPGDADGFLACDRVVMETGEPVVNLEETQNRPAGRVTFLTSKVPLRDASGAVIGVLGMYQDITARKRLEEEFRQSQKMEAVGRLAGGIAHDFNNLLTVISGNADLVRQRGEADPELIDDIRKAADRAAALVRQLLTFSRRQPVRPEVVDLNDVVGGLAGLLRRLLGERVVVRTDLADRPVRVKADRGQLEQVVMNLAVNARDAMPDGGTLTIATAAEAAAGADPTTARLTVTDTGVGMTDEVKARVFEPFFTTKGPDKGTGLGLATVYGIVAQAGGHVEVASAPGTGTTFRIDLPWTGDPPGLSTLTPVQNHALRPPAGRGVSVLLVEDEAGVRKLGRFALEGHGYAVAEAPDAEAALDSFDPDRPPDLLVTDLTMPGMDGHELAARLRAARPQLGVVFVSGYVPEADRLAGIPRAVFLPKPFTPAELLRAARKALCRSAPVERPARA